MANLVVSEGQEREGGEGGGVRGESIEGGSRGVSGRRGK